MPKGFGHKKYLVLTKEDLTKQVEGRALRSKTTSATRQYILGKIACRYACGGKIVADREELNYIEAHVFFVKIGFSSL